MRKISVGCGGIVEVEDGRPYTGKARPREQAKICVDVQCVQCSCDTALLDSRYLLSEGADTWAFGDAVSAIDRALEMAFSVMVDGESALVTVGIPGRYISDDLAAESVTLTFTAHLDIVENGKSVFEFTPKEKLAIGIKFKNLGSGLYREGSVSKQLSAAVMFRNAVRWLSMISPDEAKDVLAEIGAIKCQCYNNLALFHLHQCHYKLSIAAATTVLMADAANVKALYRRAVANTAIQNYETAIDDIEAALVIDPSNAAVRKQYELVRRKQRAVAVKYATAMKKFFHLKNP